MSSWNEIEAAAPELAAAVQARFDAHRHKTMATIRRDGSPRISGTEVLFADGDVWFGSMPGATKARDLQRDGRCALHGATVDETLVAGDAKIAGVAVEVTDLDEIRRAWPDWEESEHMGPAGAHAFRLEVTEVALAQVADDQMVITSWNARDGVQVRRP